MRTQEQIFARKEYMKIISFAKSQNRSKHDGNYYERHHILPKSLFPKYAKEKRNLVLLTAREHFIVHQFLVKIYPTRQMIYALYAFTSRPNSDYKITAEEYEEIKKQRSIEMSKQMKGNTYGFKKGQVAPITLKKLRGEKIIPWNKGKGKKYEPKIAKPRKPVSEETKKKISKANKGKPTWCKGIKMTEKQKENMKINARKRARNCGYKILLVNTNEIFDCLQDIIDKYPQFLKSHILSCINGFRKYHGILNNQKCVWKKLI